MTLQAQAEQALSAIAPFADSRELLTCHDAGLTLTCELVALDRLACGVARFEVQNPALAGGSMDRLKQIADVLAKRLTYLLEPISPIEADAQQCVVQLRSNPPEQNGNGRSYYELLVSAAGKLSLCRFTKQNGAPRETIPAQLTREVLLRLVGDFAAAK